MQLVLFIYLGLVRAALWVRALVIVVLWQTSNLIDRISWVVLKSFKEIRAATILAIYLIVLAILTVLFL